MSARRQTALISIVIFGTLVAPATGWAKRAEVDHALWDEVLARYVHDGRVDYAGLMTSRSSVEAYLYDVAEAAPEDLRSPADQLAFWINAYNACVIKGTLDHYPIPSVRRIQGFFDRITYRIAGRDLALNQIEAAGRAVGDWRIHMALVCASASCPPLRNEAYTAERLEGQLRRQTAAFLRDPTRGIRIEGATLLVSSIVKWYAGDFAQGPLTAEALLEVWQPYLDPLLLEAARGRRLQVRFLPYDWSLNDAASASNR